MGSNGVGLGQDSTVRVEGCCEIQGSGSVHVESCRTNLDRIGCGTGSVWEAILLWGPLWGHGVGTVWAILAEFRDNLIGDGIYILCATRGTPPAHS